MLDQFFADIEKARNELKFQPGEECFYRGHADRDWPLLPSLFRRNSSKTLTSSELRDLEATLFYEFQARARELRHRKLSAWDTLFFMRHHGVATRILDWTEVLGVALYFAINGSSRKSPCIWLLNPYALNSEKDSWQCRDLVAPQYLSDVQNNHRDYDWFLHGHKAPFGWKMPVALYPVKISDRLHAQSGYFTIHGEDTRPMLDIIPTALRCVEIDAKVIPELEQFLQRAGINTNTLFPDLDGLARHLHEKYDFYFSPQQSVYGK